MDTSSIFFPADYKRQWNLALLPKLISPKEGFKGRALQALNLKQLLLDQWGEYLACWE